MTMQTTNAFAGGALGDDRSEPLPRANGRWRTWPGPVIVGILLALWVIAMASALRNPTNTPAGDVTIEFTGP